MSMRRFSRLRGWRAALLAIATLGRAAGAEAPYRISFRAPEGCPSEQAFVDDVSAQVKDPSSGDGAQLAVVITEESGGYVGSATPDEALGRGLAIPVALSDLRAGDNTLDLRMPAPAPDVTEGVANISLTLEL